MQKCRQIFATALTLRERLREFIGRNLAWYGLTLLLSEEFQVLRDPAEALVLLPLSGPNLPESQSSSLENELRKRKSTLHVLFPGRARIPRAFLRETSSHGAVQNPVVPSR